MTRLRNPLRTRVDYPMVSPRHLADQVEGGCTVKLYTGATPTASRLEINVQFRISIYDHRDDPRVWEALRNALWIGFDGSTIGFPLTRAYATESTLTLESRYPGQGTIDRIRKHLVLRLAPSESPSGGVLLEVRTVHKTARRPAPPVNSR